MAMFSRAVFQVAYRVTTGSRVKTVTVAFPTRLKLRELEKQQLLFSRDFRLKTVTVAFPTRLKLREWANVNIILIKFMDF